MSMPRNLIDLVVLNLWENDLLFDAQAVIAAAVEGARADAAKIPDARNSDAPPAGPRKFVHAVAAQGHFAGRSPGRRVTLNVATDFFALVTAGFWPGDLGHVGVAASMTFLSATASPTPIFTVIFSIRGTSMVFLSSSFFLKLGHDLFVENLFAVLLA